MAEPEHVEYVFSPSDDGNNDGDGDFVLDDHRPDTANDTAGKATTLTEAEVLHEIDSSSSAVKERFGVSYVVAVDVLRRHQWSPDRVNESYTRDEAADTFVSNDRETECCVCFELHPAGDAFALSCDHMLCGGCWKGYLIHALNNRGPFLINLPCPHGKCAKTCGLLPFNTVFSAADAHVHIRLSDVLVADFVEKCGFRPCPNQTCGRVGKQRTGFSSLVVCDCRQRVCVGCGHAHHAPATCGDIRQWHDEVAAHLTEIGQRSTESWLSANAKQCPGCHCPIQKSEGCDHMTCTVCRHEWCWVCAGNWRDHRTCPGPVPNVRTNPSTSRFVQVYEVLEKLEAIERDANHVFRSMDERTTATLPYTSHDLAYLKPAAEALVKSRRALRYAQVRLYFHPDDDPCSNIGVLEKLTDDLHVHVRLMGQGREGVKKQKGATMDLTGCVNKLVASPFME